MKVILRPSATWETCKRQPHDQSSCQARHVGFVSQGALAVKGDDGSERTLYAGEAYVIMPGHHSRVVGEQDAVLYEFESVLDKVIVPHAHTEGLDFDGALSHDEPIIESKSFNAPDILVDSKGKMFRSSVLIFDSAKISKTTGKLGGTWAEHIRPSMDEHISCDHTSCTKRHVGFVMSGKFKVTLEETGESATIGPGDSFVVEPGHHGEVVGTEDMIMYEFITGL